MILIMKHPGNIFPVLGARTSPQVPHISSPICASLRKEECISGKFAIRNSNGCLSPSEANGASL